MKKINSDENLIYTKLLHHKNELIRAQKEKNEKKMDKFTSEPAENIEENPGTSKKDQQFPWNQKQQRPQRNRGRGGRGKNNLLL